MTTIYGFLLKIIRAGNRAGLAGITDASLKRRVILNNQLTWVAFFVMASYVPIWSAVGFYPLAINLIVWQAIFIWPIFYWTSRGFYSWARYSLILGCSFGIAGDALLDGRAGGHHYYFFTSAFFAVILFDIHERIKFAIATAIPVAVWLILEMSDYNLVPTEFRVHQNNHQHLIYLINMLGSYSICAYLFLRFALTSQEFERKAIESSKMAALGQMSGGMAHEINNPLAIIKGKSMQLRRKISSHNFSEELLLSELKKIEDTSERIALIIKSLRKYSQQQSQNDPFLPIQVAQIFRVVSDLCGARFMNHQVELRIDEKFAGEIECRDTDIAQVLLNLLNNSFDAVINTPNAWVEMRSEQIGSLLRVTITDSGTGIPQDIRNRIMEPFFTTKQIGQGAGLGLSTAQGIVRDHSGRIYLDPDCANTRFVIELPIRQNEICLVAA